MTALIPFKDSIMPIVGDAKKVKKNMEKQYGKKEGEKVFYATANKEGRTPETWKKKEKKTAAFVLPEDLDLDPSDAYINALNRAEAAGALPNSETFDQIGKEWEELQALRAAANTPKVASARQILKKLAASRGKKEGRALQVLKKLASVRRK